VSISEDEMKAHLNFNIPKEVTGKLTIAIIRRILKKAGVQCCVLTSILNKFIQKYNKQAGSGEKLLIARGSPEIMAEDGSLRFHDFFTRKIEIKRIKKKGKQKKLELLPAIITGSELPPGTKLLIKTQAQVGKEGLTITGKKIWSKENKKQVFSPVVSVSKNVSAASYIDRIEYVSEVRGIGYFINNQIIEVDEVYDGSFKIFVSPDKMNALLSVQAPHGGKKIEFKEVLKEAGNMVIKAPLNQSLIKITINQVNNGEQAKIDRVCICSGELPVHGLNGDIRWNMRLEIMYKPLVSKDGSVDYKGGGRFPFIREGNIAAVWFLPTKGQKPGVNIFGNPITPQDGVDIELTLGDYFEFEDSNYNKRKVKLLKAKCSGLLKIKKSEVTVQPVFETERVDYATGNIDFDGTIVIKETILDGFMVKCSKDIQIRGGLGACKIECGGDAIIDGGINGRGQGSIKAGGNVYIKYAENCVIQAKKSIYIGTHSVLSTLWAKDEIRVGLNRVKGRVIGGILYAWNSIKTGIVGSERAAYNVFLWLGIDREIALQIEELEKQIAKVKVYITNLQSKIENMKNEDAANQVNFQETKEQKLKELNGLVQSLNELNEKLYNEECAAIEVADKVFAHTNINIRTLSLKLKTHITKARIILKNNKIIHEPLSQRK